jgi:hypothetical protein
MSLSFLLLPHAQAGALKVGSGNEAVIEPPVPHPDETPCTVPLVTDGKFGANAVNYSYTPPAACPGPWAKVVLSMHISLDKGVQFDRSGYLFMGNIPLWFGTTAEPRATLGPSWTFEKDVTDYTAVFESAQTGYLQIPNYQSSVYTSTITGSATLLFYPPTSASPAPVTADMVLPLPAGGGVATLNTGANQVTTTATLPTNILHATLDLYLQGQSSDEFWYFCVPNSLSGELESCGGTAFREGEVTVDGVAAGVAPIYPWIFTGGIDPFLWQPIPGVQTLDFKPFHADLSPFAGVLSNGSPHTIATSVYNANGYFSATGALRLFLDKNATTVTGSVTTNTLSAANPVITPTLSSANGVTTGSVDTKSNHDFTIIGTVTGSAGTITNKLVQTTHFSNDQQFKVTATQDRQILEQKTDTVITTSSTGGGTKTKTTETLQYPLNIYYNFLELASGKLSQLTQVNLQFLQSVLTETDKQPTFQYNLSDAIAASDTLFFNADFNITGNNNASSTASFLLNGTGYPCFQRTLSSVFNVVSAVQTGC